MGVFNSNPVVMRNPVVMVLSYEPEELGSCRLLVVVTALSVLRAVLLVAYDLFVDNGLIFPARTVTYADRLVSETSARLTSLYILSLNPFRNG